MVPGANIEWPSSLQLLTILGDLGEPLVEKGGKGWDLIGDAVHAYLGLPPTALRAAVMYSAAERILSRRDAGGVLSAEMIIEVGRRWTEWIDTTFLGAEVITESPIAWRNDGGQVMEGWIEARIVLSNGEHVLVDHKSYSGTDTIGHINANYLGQLSIYNQALNKLQGSAPGIGADPSAVARSHRRGWSVRRTEDHPVISCLTWKELCRMERLFAL